MSKFVTYVIRLPDAQESKAAISSGVCALVEQHGGEKTRIENGRQAWQKSTGRRESD